MDMDMEFQLIEEETALRRESCLLIAIPAVFFYDYVLSFDDEVKFIWRRKMSLAQLLYVWMRFICIIYFVASLIETAITNVAFTGSISTELGTLLSDLGWLSVVTTILITQTSAAIQSLRIYAMFGSPKWMKYTLLAWFAVTTAVGSFLYVYYADLRGKPQWFMLLAFISETIFLVLVLYIAYKRQCFFVKSKSSNEMVVETEDLICIMIGDSIKYFVAIFVVYTLSILIVFVKSFGDVFDSTGVFGTEPIISSLLAFSGILSPRLLLNLRREYYTPEDAQGMTRSVAWEVAVPSSGSEGSTMELDTDVEFGGELGSSREKVEA
ncbi:hypothetical protein SCHPADRAFT_947387 [Schizopora paradoxa]|uniref:DUF6533 domain-containing protein n=1 Tax=Schizopora paradoxa TaxID=27342 RepID=A0A0H2R5U9_9AGAM|nr:hypothetical protein SCHPADRAFT_947387 [Schizopora paradoxa]